MQIIDATKLFAATKRLREVHAKALAGGYATPAQPSLSQQDQYEVLMRFQPMLSPAALPNLTAEDFKSFVYQQQSALEQYTSQTEVNVCKYGCVAVRLDASG